MAYMKPGGVLDQAFPIQALATQTASVAAVARNFADYVDRVAYRGERFTLVRRGTPVAELTPVTRGIPIREIPALFASLPRHLTIEEADAFARDLEDARTEADSAGMRDPWES